MGKPTALIFGKRSVLVENIQQATLDEWVEPGGGKTISVKEYNRGSLSPDLPDNLYNQIIDKLSLGASS